MHTQVNAPTQQVLADTTTDYTYTFGGETDGFTTLQPTHLDGIFGNGLGSAPSLAHGRPVDGLDLETDSQMALQGHVELTDGADNEDRAFQSSDEGQTFADALGDLWDANFPRGFEDDQQRDSHTWDGM
jgi:hypothetical protein